MSDQMEKLQDLTDRIHKLRGLLADQDSPPHLIVRQKHHSRSMFKRRVKSLQKLEVQRTRLIENIARG